jgi:RNA polymerase sigma factor (sigma-70 family)
METDSSLIARVLAGDDNSYAKLIERHQARCYRYAFRFLGDIDEAEDAVQETLVRAYRSLHQCANPDRFQAWLFQILVNRCRSAYDRRMRRERRLARAALDEHVATQVEDSWVLEVVEQAIAKLSADQREALLLKFVEDMTYEEISQITGMSASAAKMRVSRATQFLRSRLRTETH